MPKKNYYLVTNEQREKFLPELKKFINEVEANPKEYKEIDFTEKGINPFQLWTLLNELGYEDEPLEDNGWQLDFWVHFVKDDCVELVLYGTGITFEVGIHTAEE